MTSNSPPPPSTVEQEQEEKEHFHEVILEDEEEPEVEVCGADNKEVIVEQDAWEEETVCSVVETASQIQSRGKKRKSSKQQRVAFYERQLQHSATQVTFNFCVVTNHILYISFSLKLHRLSCPNEI